MQQQNLPENIRLGIKQYTICHNAESFYILRVSKNGKLNFYLIFKNELIFILDSSFGRSSISKPIDYNQQLSDFCLDKINIRSKYKITSLLTPKSYYSHNLDIIFLLTSSGELAAFNDALYFLGTFKIQCCNPDRSNKYALDYLFFEKQQVIRKVKTVNFLFLYPDSLEFFQIEINSNHKLSDYKPSYKFSTKQLKKKVVWNKVSYPLSLQCFWPQIKINMELSVSMVEDQKKGLSISANETVAAVVRMAQSVYLMVIKKNDLQIIESHHITKICQSPTVISTVDCLPVKRRIFLGLSKGAIKGYSYKQMGYYHPLFTITLDFEPYIYAFKLISQDKLIVASRDQYLRVINLENYGAEQIAKIGNYEQMQFLDNNLAVGKGSHKKGVYNNRQDNPYVDQFIKSLVLNEISLDYNVVFRHNSQINVCFQERSIQILQFSDNSILFMNQKQSKLQIDQSFMPPHSTSALCICNNIFYDEKEGNEQYWVLTEKSQIYKYNYSQGIGKPQIKITEILQLHSFVDKFKIEYKYHVNTFCFLKQTVPLQFDSEINQKTTSQNKEPYESFRPICFGTTTGQILIVSMKKITFLVCRLRYFSQSISQIVDILSSGQSDKSLLVFTSQLSKKMILTQVSSREPPKILYNHTSSDQKLRILNNNFFCIIQGPRFNIFYYNLGELYKENHKEVTLVGNPYIVNVSISQNNQQLLVSYSFGQIVIWKIDFSQEDLSLAIWPWKILQNSNQYPSFFMYLLDSKIYFDLDQNIVCFDISKHDPHTRQDLLNERVKVGKVLYQTRKDKEKKVKNISKEQKEEKYDSRKRRVEQKSQFYLPKIGNSRISSLNKIRSNSMLTQQVSLKPRTRRKSSSKQLQLMFHFPKQKLYDELLYKNNIYL